MPEQTTHTLIDGASAKSINIGAGQSLSDIFGTPTSNAITPTTAWSEVAYVFRAVELRAGAVSSLPWQITRGDAEYANHEDYANIPWLQNIEKLFYLTEASLCIVSQAYWYKLRSRRREPVQLQWFAPGTMSPVWDLATGELTGYRRSANGRMYTIPVDDVVYYRGPNPLSETAPGPSPVSAALGDAGVIYGLNEFAKAFFDRGAIRATLLTVDGTPTRQERDRLKSWWARVFSGVSNAFGAEVFTSAVTPVTVGDGVSDLGNSELTESKREAIATAMGIPQSLLMSNASNFATANADRLSFYDFTVNPSANHVQAVANTYLFEPLGLKLKFLPETLPIYREDENERSSAYATYISAGMPASITAELLQIPLPEGMEYSELDVEPEPVPEALADPGDAEEEADEAKRAEMRQFKKWYKKRTDPDPTKFRSDLLTDADKSAIMATLTAEDADGESATFPVMEWAAYP